MESKNLVIETYAKISDLVMELSSLNNLDQIEKFIHTMISRLIIIEEEYFFTTDEKGNINSKNEISEEIKDLAAWAAKSLKISMFPLDSGKSALILPFSKSQRLLLIYICKTTVEEISNETMLFLNILSFLTATIIENLQLYSEILKTNKIVEKNRDFLNQILNSMISGLAVFDKSYKKIFFNSNFEKFEKAFGDEMLKFIKNELINLEISGEKLTKEYEYKNHFLSIDFLKTNDENYLVIISDITGTKELERLRKLDQMKTEFLSTVSHELRTPLAAIKAYSESIVDSLEILDEETLKDFMLTILNEADHLQNLLDEILDFSRLEMKTLNIKKENFSLNELIEEIYISNKNKAEANGIKIYKVLPKENIIVNLDRTRVKQILSNLIDNAIKYSDKRKDMKFVKITLKSEDDKVLILVEDNGIGISKEHHEKIFEKFYRVDSSLTYEISGTGIGLSVVKELVEIQGGKIWLKSVEGKGTRFYIEFKKGK
ncbi:two-component system, OmpR family, sensor kinase [Marinitoga hydrogenitolerans DSM 16785]|uniref:histidine kinase n=1 Tax=Marinitoga hydrogenitolerans (strain DSM 16785 / JCM 12826 / AT1271) TaxID=1122195 RepID=A0A1M4VQ94_MARH1|nr:HAMP domain-containing sensor histidine kinase [Marinitoga hydrogenitolerans]SHE71206.1 two-component system, OmpR family, sensor kinase [Marinitoga hydrogenitolerans DSM 16785]